MAETSDEAPAATDDESPAMDIGFRPGLVLAVVALAWAFVGPAHLLEIGRYELPIVASFVDPLPYTFFAYVGAVTFSIALVAGLAYPSLVEDEGGYAIDLAIGVITPAIAVALVVAVLGFVVPAVFYAVSGELVRAGLILVGVVVVVAAALVLRTIAIIVIAIWSAPLWLPAILGAGLAQVIRGVVG